MKALAFSLSFWSLSFWCLLSLACLGLASLFSLSCGCALGPSRRSWLRLRVSCLSCGCLVGGCVSCVAFWVRLSALVRRGFVVVFGLAVSASSLAAVSPRLVGFFFVLVVFVCVGFGFVWLGVFLGEFDDHRFVLLHFFFELARFFVCFGGAEVDHELRLREWSVRCLLDWPVLR